MGQGSPDRTGFRPVGIVHEHEYVTPKWMLENPVVADVVGWMENIRTGRTQVPKGYAEGGATTDTPLSITQARENSTAQQQINADLIPVLTEIKTLLSDLKEKGVEAWMVENAQNGKSIKRAIKKFEQIENRNARK